MMKEEKEKITITKTVDFWWDCPVCEETNQIEMDGDCFNTPIVCGNCNTPFEDYKKDF